MNSEIQCCIQGTGWCEGQVGIEPLPIRDLSIKLGEKIKISVGSAKTRRSKINSDAAAVSSQSFAMGSGLVDEDVEWGDFTG